MRSTSQGGSSRLCCLSPPHTPSSHLRLSHPPLSPHHCPSGRPHRSRRLHLHEGTSSRLLPHVPVSFLSHTQDTAGASPHSPPPRRRTQSVTSATLAQRRNAPSPNLHRRSTDSTTSMDSDAPTLDGESGGLTPDSLTTPPPPSISIHGAGPTQPRPKPKRHSTLSTGASAGCTTPTPNTASISANTSPLASPGLKKTPPPPPPKPGARLTEAGSVASIASSIASSITSSNSSTSSVVKRQSDGSRPPSQSGTSSLAVAAAAAASQRRGITEDSSLAEAAAEAAAKRRTPPPLTRQTSRGSHSLSRSSSRCRSNSYGERRPPLIRAGSQRSGVCDGAPVFQSCDASLPLHTLRIIPTHPLAPTLLCAQSALQSWTFPTLSCRPTWRPPSIIPSSRSTQNSTTSTPQT